MEEILELLNQGGNVVRQVVVPEGLTSWQVVRAPERRSEELTGEIAEMPPEGTLAPAGYDFQRGDSAGGPAGADAGASRQEILGDGLGGAGAGPAAGDRRRSC